MYILIMNRGFERPSVSKAVCSWGTGIIGDIQICDWLKSIGNDVGIYVYISKALGICFCGL